MINAEVTYVKAEASIHIDYTSKNKKVLETLTAVDTAVVSIASAYVMNGAPLGEVVLN